MVLWLAHLLDLLEYVPDPLPPDRDYITTGGQLILATLAVVSAFLVWRTELARQEAKRATAAGHEATAAAVTAGAYAEPTGDGFAGDVIDRLSRMEAAQRTQSRDIGGMREDIRSERTERIALARTLSIYMERQT